jgi:hypothetical protein
VKVVLACDESGAKGYADQDEQFPGEVGVFAGLLVPEDILQQVETDLEAVLTPFRKDDAKLHITDLDPAQQEILRNGVYVVIEKLKIPCFWYAVHVAGFHDHHCTLQKINTEAREAAKALNPNPRIKTGSPSENPESLHAVLFEGLYSHIIAFIEERRPGQVTINVRTDRVDSSIAKCFRKRAEGLLSDTPRVQTIPGYDTQTERPVIRATVTFEAVFPEEWKVKTTVTELTLTPVQKDDPLVVAADILANGLFYHFRNRGADKLYTDLNRVEAILDHPLAKSLDTFRNWGGPDLIGDRLFRHPKAPPPAG